MKNFENAEIVELSLQATALEPTDDKAVDMWENGWAKQGTNSGSGQPDFVPDYSK